MTFIQSPKSIAEIPFLICFSGLISSDDKTTAIKLDPLIIEDELTKEVIFFLISFLNSDIVIFSSKIMNIHLLLSLFI